MDEPHTQASESFNTSVAKRANRRRAFRIMLVLFVSIGIAGIWYAQKQEDNNFVTQLVDKIAGSDSSESVEQTPASAALNPAPEANTVAVPSEIPLDGYVTVYADNHGRYISIPANTALSYISSITSTDASKELSVTQTKQRYAEALTSSGYKESPSSNASLAAYEQNRGISRFVHQSTICTLQASGDKTAIVITRLCADTADTEKTAEYTQPFVDAYKAAGKSNGGTPLVTKTYEALVDDSVVEGYQYTTVSIGDIANTTDYLFIRKSSESWKYFGPVLGDQLSCKIYDNELKRNALAHMNCIGQNSQQTTVKEYFAL